MQEAFAEPGGEALASAGSTIARTRCMRRSASRAALPSASICRTTSATRGRSPRLIDRRSDDELLALMSNLGGHDMASMIEAFEAIDHDRPVCFIAYTIKGVGLPMQGHKDNHAGPDDGRADGEVAHRAEHPPRPRVGQVRGPVAGAGRSSKRSWRRRRSTARAAAGSSAPVIDVPQQLAFKASAQMSTQQGFGLVLHELARGDSELASRIVTASPDVTVSTNLGAWVNRRGLFAKAENHDLFRQEKIPSTFTWEYSPKGQHLELGIAEMNLFIMLSALGLSHQINGERLLPVGTLYDPFIERGLDALNYACYQDARFMVAATPSGITLAPEGGAHQSIKTPLIGIGQDGLASFDPAFVDELAVIMGWGFRHMQREGARGRFGLLAALDPRRWSSRSGS